MVVDCRFGDDYGLAMNDSWMYEEGATGSIYFQLGCRQLHIIVT